MTTKNAPKRYAYTLETSTVGNLSNLYYADATITVHEVQNYSDGKTYLNDIFTIKLYSHRISEHDAENGLISTIQPACYYQNKERWPYSHWTIENVAVRESWGLYTDRIDLSSTLIKKINGKRVEVESDWKIAYDKLDSVIKSLGLAGIVQAKATHYSEAIIFPRGVFSRTDLDGLDLPSDDECYAPAYPWEVDETTEPAL